MKNIRNFIALIAVALFTFACTKTEEPIIEKPAVTDDYKSTIPEGSRLKISFAQTAYRGCMYTFRNCIVIDLGFDRHPALTNALVFNTPTGVNPYDAVGKYYGRYFPLTDDFSFANEKGQTQTYKAGIYPITQTSAGPTVVFSPEKALLTAPLVNTRNPQDNIGQLHNLYMQEILTDETRAEIKRLGKDKAAIRALLVKKATAPGDPIRIGDVKLGLSERSQLAQLPDNYTDEKAWPRVASMNDYDIKAMVKMMAILNNYENQTPVATPEAVQRSLNILIREMTALENEFSVQMSGNPHLMQSLFSVAKYSTYYWSWNAISKAAADSPVPIKLKPWWRADIRGLLQGGLGQSIVDSLMAALEL